MNKIDLINIIEDLEDWGNEVIDKYLSGSGDCFCKEGRYICENHTLINRFLDIIKRGESKCQEPG
jgi:hypothetical protein